MYEFQRDRKEKKILILWGLSGIVSLFVGILIIIAEYDFLTADIFADISYVYVIVKIVLFLAFGISVLLSVCVSLWNNFFLRERFIGHPMLIDDLDLGIPYEGLSIFIDDANGRLYCMAKGERGNLMRSVFLFEIYYPDLKISVDELSGILHGNFVIGNLDGVNMAMVLEKSKK